MELLKQLAKSHGYITQEGSEELGILFRGNLNVIVKDYFGERYCLKLNNLEENLKASKIDVREVFINSETYELLGDALARFNTKDEVVDYVLNNQNTLYNGRIVYE